MTFLPYFFGSDAIKEFSCIVTTGDTILPVSISTLVPVSSSPP